MFKQSFSFAYLNLSFEKRSILFNAATLAKKEVHSATSTPIFVPTPFIDEDVPSVSLLIPTKILKIFIYNLFLFLCSFFSIFFHGS